MSKGVVIRGVELCCSGILITGNNELSKKSASLPKKYKLRCAFFNILFQIGRKSSNLTFSKNLILADNVK